MTSNSFNENTDIDKWIEDCIANDKIIYHDYNEFQCIDSGEFSNLYKTNWKSSNTVVALRSFGTNGCIKEKIVNEVNINKVTF